MPKTDTTPAEYGRAQAERSRVQDQLDAAIRLDREHSTIDTRARVADCAERFTDAARRVEIAELTMRPADLGPCQWFALCDHAATSTLPHPVLADVPICDRCRAKVARLDPDHAGLTAAETEGED